MQTETIHTYPVSRRSFSLPKKLELVALLCVALACGIMSFIVGSFALIIVATVVLIGAVVVATKLRWAPFLGSLLSALLLYYFLLKSSFPVYHLTHPSDDPVFFLLTLLNIVCMAVALGAGIVTGVQNYRKQA